MGGCPGRLLKHTQAHFVAFIEFTDPIPAEIFIQAYAVTLPLLRKVLMNEALFT